MSTSLLRKSLELVETDFVRNYTVVKGKRKEDKKVFTELSVKKKTKNRKINRSIADVKRCNINSVNNIKKKLKKKNINKEYKEKLRLLHKPPSKSVVNKILEKLGYGDKEKKNIEKDQKTAFTEKDFLDFEREYVGTN